MKVYEIKFKIETELKNRTDIDKTFKKLEKDLNLYFNENFELYKKENEINYEIKDISNLKEKEIKKIEENFFKFQFDIMSNVPLYRFLILEDKEKITLLSILHSSIANLKLINKIFESFNSSQHHYGNDNKKNYVNNENYYINNNINNDYDYTNPNQLLRDHNEIKNYLLSNDFKKDSAFWKNHLNNVGEYIKFFNLKSKTTKSKKIELDNKALEKFLKENSISKYDFITAIFSLYLSRIDRTKGCLIKTIISEKELEKRTLLKIDYDEKCSFLDYVNEIKKISKLSKKHTKFDIGYYLENNPIDDDLQLYEIYDFTDINGAKIKNGENAPLTVNIYNNSLEMIFNEIFKDEYIENMASNIKHVIAEILENPHKACGDIDLINDDEKKLIKKFSKGEEIKVKKDKTLSIAFHENALKHPQRIAIDDGFNKISYGELDRLSNSIAYDLKNNYKISYGDTVGLILPRDYHFIELVLALNKIGAIFIPIDSQYPLKRIKHMMSISKSKHIITTKELSESYDFKEESICIEDLNRDYDKKISYPASGDDLFAIVFTSGTTGLPKGVSISNKQISGISLSLREIYNTKPGDISGCYSSFSFGGSFRIYFAIYCGETCRIFNDNERNDSLLFIEALKKQALNDLILPPSIGLLIFENEDVDLNYLSFAGSKIQELPKKNSHTQLVNVYGATETLMATTSYLDPEKDIVPVGKPLANTWAYVLDKNHNFVPIGTPGEIFFSGEFISPGYFNAPEKTSKSFIENPHSDCKENKIMYSTGDIGYYNFDGEIEIIGREDDQLSVRSFRIESSEILNIMNKFNQIKDVYLDVDYDNLIAYYTIKEKIDINEIKESLLEELPRYMIPSLFVKVDEIPLNNNGKVDRFALRNISEDESQIVIEDKTLKLVVDCFKKILNTNAVSINTNFKKLGGNSLSAMKLQLALKEEMDVNIYSREIMELSTPAKIANHIKFNSKTHMVNDANYSYDNLCPLSESQLNIYLDEEIKKMGTAYNNPFKIEFKKNYPIESIIHAIESLFDTYPILSARVRENDKKLYFSFDGKREIAIKEKEEIDNFVYPFELDKSLSRFLISNDGRFLCFDCHHLIFDGSSLNNIIKSLMNLLNGKKLNFVDDGVLRQTSFEENISHKYMEDGERFFETILNDRDEVYELLASVKYPYENNIEKEENYEFNLKLNADKDSLRKFLQNHSITHNQFFTSVFAYTLSRFSGSSKVLFNLIEDGRGYLDISDSVGMFVRTLPLIIDCKNQSIRSFMEYSANIVHNAMKYDLYPFRSLANKYDLNSDIYFQYAHDIFKNINNNNSEFKINEMRHDVVGDMIFYIYDLDNDSFGLKVSYSKKYSTEFISKFVESFTMISKEMINAECLSEINYINQNDLKLLDTYNKTEHELEYDDILCAFNENLKKDLDKELAVFNNKTYTFGEGAYIADIIAKKLIEFGVKSQDCIAFLVERSEWYLLSILGILSIGGIYVPLDDNLPDDRLRFMIRDTQSKVILASDNTYSRAKDLGNESIVLNVSDILKEDIKTATSLANEYGELACILYTSGTTGVPKGVKVRRISLLNVALDYISKYGLNSNDKFALFSTIGFDVSSFVISSILCSGASIHIIPEEIKLDMLELNKYFINNNISHSFITTQVAKLFMKLTDNTSLDVLLVAGEKLGEVKSPKNYLLVDAYGPTEAFAFISSIENSDKIDYSSIGLLNYNAKKYILDAEGRQIPIGAVGELYLSGNQIAKGYLNRDEETENSFLRNPFNDEKDYSTIYSTGDMVRILNDGTISIVGRQDSQVKIRGNRVELTEIESEIRNIEYVNDVTVQIIEHNGNNELVAYIVTSKEIDENILREKVRKHMAIHKPDYMVPSFVVKLENIPLNINGKVDRRALPKVNIDSLKEDYVAPMNEREKLIVEAFEKTFEKKGIGLFDDFLRLGGDSISAIHINSYLERNNISASAKDILKYKTPYAIAKNLKDSNEISYEATEGNIDLLPIQSYFFDKVNKNNYSQEFIIKAKAKIDIKILEKAFDELSNIHDMLRVRYEFHKDKIIQKSSKLNTRVYEIKEQYISSNFDERLKEILIESINSLDMKSKLIDINLIHHNKESYIIFTIHHLIVDGVSWNILLNDLSRIYTQISSNEKIEILRPYPYKNWVNDIIGLVENISDEEKEHWIKTNRLLDKYHLKGKSKTFAFNIDISYNRNNLLGLSEEEYWALAIARAYKKTFNENIIFNRESYGRDETLANLNRTVGWFTSQYPVEVKTNTEYDHISLIEDAYSIKKAFQDVKNLGLNYASLAYISKEIEFKHCPVTFNFLSREFSYNDDLFESFNMDLDFDMEILSNKLDSESFGINFNILRLDSSYTIKGDYALDTFIGEKFDEFIAKIKDEIEYISSSQFNDIIVCNLSEPQLSVYLDEKLNNMRTAYSTSGTIRCDNNKTLKEIEDSIASLIDKHPILKSRIVQRDIPLLVCDANPDIEIINGENQLEREKLFKMKKPFDLNKSLARFQIMENKNEKYIFFDIHHIINDATGCKIIKEDIEKALKGELDETKDFGFVYESHNSFDSKFEKTYEKAHEFFKEKLEDIDDTYHLLDDIEGSKARVSLVVPGVKKQTEEFTEKLGITVSSFLNAIFAYTYSCFTASEKVFYNFSEHGRHETYAKNAIGMFTRTIPIIIECSNKPIDNYLKSVSDLIIDSMTNSIYPYRKLASEFDLNNNVGFEYNFDLNDLSEFNINLNTTEIILNEDINDPISDLLCAINDFDDGYLINVEHSDKFSNETITRFVKSYKEILIQILEKEYLSDINYTSKEDISLLEKYNETEYPLEYEDILESFNSNLKQWPKNILVSYKNNSYRYDESAFISRRIAEELIDLGVKPQDTVAFLTKASEYYMFSILSILSIGAIYVPLDEKHPNERIEFILRDTSSKVLIVSDESLQRAQNLEKDCIILNISNILKEKIECLSSLPFTSGDLACILYTSGTTGIPKGVKITRKSILNASASYVKRYGISQNDVYGLYAAIGFDIGSLAICQSIYSGSCLSIIPNEIKLDMGKLNEYFINQNITYTSITAQVAKMFMENIEETSLKLLSVGGEKLGDFESPKNYRLMDEYGPSETFAFISSIDNSKKIDSSSVGKLNYNTKAYILDSEGRRVPFGAVGELCLSGYQIAKGYLNRKEENSKAFIDNPFDDNEDYDKIYRTGDMVRILNDGTIGIVGRRDGQVKIRGNRVELSEIESVIRQLDFIKDVTVQTMKNRSNTELVAYIVSDKKTHNLKDLISNHISERKPDYMVPSFVVEMDEIPLTVNGKVNKSALPEIDIDSLHVEYIAPRNMIERAITNAFEEVFNQKDIGINDDFIKLGGDSITAIRVISLLQKNNLEVKAKTILDKKTPYLIAQNVIEKTEINDYEATEGVVDLLPIQNYFFEEINSNQFTQEFLLKSKKVLDIDILKDSFNELFKIHDMLRVTYKTDENHKPIQEIRKIDSQKSKSSKYETQKYKLKNEIQKHANQTNEIHEYKISDKFDKEIKEIVLKSIKSIDINSKLIDINLIHYNDETYLLIVIHHLIIDGVSWNILLNDLTDIYTNLEAKRDNNIPRPYPYKNWIEDIKRLAEKISPDEEKNWIEINDSIDASSIKGPSQGFNFNIHANYNPDNLLNLSEEEFFALAIARA